MKWSVWAKHPSPFSHTRSHTALRHPATPAKAHPHPHPLPAQPYIEHFADQKDQLVYLTADSENELQEVR